MIKLKDIRYAIDREDYIEIVRERELGNQLWYGNHFSEEFDFERRGDLLITSLSMYTSPAGDNSEAIDPIMLIHVISPGGIKTPINKKNKIGGNNE